MNMSMTLKLFAIIQFAAIAIAASPANCAEFTLPFSETWDSETTGANADQLTNWNYEPSYGGAPASATVILEAGDGNNVLKINPPAGDSTGIRSHFVSFDPAVGSVLSIRSKILLANDAGGAGVIGFARKDEPLYGYVLAVSPAGPGTANIDLRRFDGDLNDSFTVGPVEIALDVAQENIFELRAAFRHGNIAFFVHLNDSPTPLFNAELTPVDSDPHDFSGGAHFVLAANYGQEAYFDDFNASLEGITIYDAVQWVDGNNHWYQVVHVPAGIRWTDARDMAEGLLDGNGYLATVTSSEENEFIWNHTGAGTDNNLWVIDGAGNWQGPWLGGYQEDQTGANDEGWVWITGEEWDYTAWAPGEPNNSGGNEWVLQYFWQPRLDILMVWNDVPDYPGVVSFVVEAPDDPFTTTKDFTWKRTAGQGSPGNWSSSTNWDGPSGQRPYRPDRRAIFGNPAGMAMPSQNLNMYDYGGLGQLLFEHSGWTIHDGGQNLHFNSGEYFNYNAISSYAGGTNLILPPITFATDHQNIHTGTGSVLVIGQNSGGQSYGGFTGYYTPTISSFNPTAQDTGALRIDVASTTNRAFFLRQGTLLLRDNAALGNSTATVNIGGDEWTTNNANARLLTDAADITVSKNLRVRSYTNRNVIAAIGGNQTSGASTFSGTLTLDLNTRLISSNTDANAVSFTNNISGIGGIEKTGPGLVILSGNNTYQGTTAVSSGILRKGSSNALPGGTNVALADVSGAQLDLNGYAQTVGSLSGGGASGGNVALGSATLTVSGGNYSGAISGTGSLTKTGSGMLTLGGLNSYGGTTTISGGTLRLGRVSALPSGTSVALANAAGALFDLNSHNQSVASLSGGGTSGGNVALGNATLTVSNGNYSGVISGTGSLAKIGGGTLVLGGANTYEGTTTISGGTLQLGRESALPAGAVVLADASGVLLDLNNYNQALTSLSGGGTSGGNIALGSATLTVVDGSYGGSISGTGGLTKVGAGTLTLSGTNSYRGITEVQHGVLLVNGQHLNGGDYSVLVQGTLGGFGSIQADIEVEDGGTLAPGVTGMGGISPGMSLDVAGSVTLDAGAILKAALADPIGPTGGGTPIEPDPEPGSGGCLLYVHDTLDISGSILDLVISSPLKQPVYLLASYRNLIGEFEDVLNLPENYELYYNYKERNVIAIATPMLTVNSIPVQGIEITGSHPGTTNYVELLPDGTPVDLAAPLQHVCERDTFNFIRWMIDDVPQPYGHLSVEFDIEADITATAVYHRMGDGDGDGRIDLLDLIYVRNRLGEDILEEDNWPADVNQDGFIDMIDLVCVRNRLCPVIYATFPPGETLLADVEIELEITSESFTIDNSPVTFMIEAVISRLDTVELTSQQPEDTTPIEIVQLTLVPTEPILVTYDNGAQSVWDMRITLTAGVSGTGEMTFTRNYECLGDFELYFAFPPIITVTDLIDEQEYVFTEVEILEIASSGEFVFDPVPGETSDPRMSGATASSDTISLPPSIPEPEPLPCAPEGKTMDITSFWRSSRIHNIKFNYEDDRSIELDRDKLDSLVSWTAWLGQWLRETWVPPPHPPGTTDPDFALSKLISVEVTWRSTARFTNRQMVCTNGFWQRGQVTVAETHEDFTSTFDGPFENYPQVKDAVMGVRP